MYRAARINTKAVWQQTNCSVRVRPFPCIAILIDRCAQAILLEGCSSSMQLGNKVEWGKGTHKVSQKPVVFEWLPSLGHPFPVFSSFWKELFPSVHCPINFLQWKVIPLPLMQIPKEGRALWVLLIWRKMLIPARIKRTSVVFLSFSSRSEQVFQRADLN